LNHIIINDSNEYTGDARFTINTLSLEKDDNPMLPDWGNFSTKGSIANVGFSDIIQGETKMSDCIMKLPGSEIEVMTSGTRRSDLTDLTTTKKLKDFFDILKQSYDYVIIDTPPIQPVSDTLFIIQATDHNLLIARSKFTKIAGIKSALKKLKNVDVKVDGLIFNDLDTSKASYYGYYQYGGYYNKYKSYS